MPNATKPTIVSSNTAPEPSLAVREIENLRLQKKLLEQQIAQIHAESREEALLLVKDLCTQYEFTSSTIGLAPVEQPAKQKSLITSLLGRKKKSAFTVGPKRAPIET